MLPPVLLIAALLGSLLPSASPYSLGAPPRVCGSLLPGHGGAEPSLTPPPFTLTPDKLSVKGGEQVTVTLKAQTVTVPFKGFLMVARDVLSSRPVGSFEEGDHKGLACDGGTMSGLTHSSAENKTEVEVVWTAPEGVEVEVVFVATAVQSFSRFWTELRSQQVKVLRAGRKAAAVETTKPMASLAILQGCEETKGCFTLPADCKTDCTVVVTYAKRSAGLYDFEVSGKLGGAGDAYVAAALSTDDRMGGDSVMACLSRGDKVEVATGVNDGKSSRIDTNPTEGLSNIVTSREDGVITCRFTREAKVKVLSETFDLEDEKFHLLLARGSVSSAGGLRQHSARSASGSPTSLASFTSLGAASATLVTLHAAMMVVAWVAAASSGMTIARFFKQTWTGCKMFGVDAWFNAHRALMGITWSLTMGSFVVILIHVGGWTDLPIKRNPHALLGVISVGLCFIQPFMAMMRCAPDDPKRPLFKWCHWFVGTVAQSLAFTAIFYGLQLVNLHQYLWWVMVLFLVVHVALQLTLSVFDCKAASAVEDVVAMRDMGRSSDMIHPGQGKQGDAPGGGRRKVVLAVYLVVAWAAAGVIVAVVAVGEEGLRKAF